MHNADKIIIEHSIQKWNTASQKKIRQPKRNRISTTQPSACTPSYSKVSQGHQTWYHSIS